MELDIREMSFQNVLNQILKPAGVKVGGFPEEIFLDMNDDEKEKWSCNICYLIVNDCRQCDNKHLFCNTCVFAWSMTYGENSQKCPLCRHEQKEYKENKDVNRSLQDKKVLCPEDACSFKAPLKIFLMHSHGKHRFSNTHVDLESLRPARSQGPRVLVLPTLEMGSRLPRTQRGIIIRNQLQQGRMMINQMMMLLHLEMQLRQQAFSSFQEVSNNEVRVHRLDEVVALNEQLNEVGTILSGLINTPLRGLSSGRGSATSTQSNSMNEPNTLSSALVRQLEAEPPPQPPLVTASSRTHNVLHDSDTEDEDSSDDEDDDDSSSMSSLSTIIHGNVNGNTGNEESSTTLSSNNRPQVTRLGSTLREGQSVLETARQRRTSTQAVLSNTNIELENSAGASNVEHVSNRPSQTSTETPGLLNRRPDQSRLSVSRSREDQTLSSSVQRISESTSVENNTQEGDTLPAVSLQLPNIRGTSPSPSRSRGSMVQTPRRSPSEESHESSTQPLIPPGSSALNHVMNDMRESRNPTRITTTTTTTTENGVTISVTASGPYRRPEPSDQARTITQTGSSSRPVESESQTDTVSNTPTSRYTPVSRFPSDENTRASEGSILPASLYRRRLHSQNNTPERIENQEPPSRTGSHPAQRQLMAHRIPGQNNSRVTRSVHGSGQSGNSRLRVDLHALNTSSRQNLPGRNSLSFNSNSLTNNSSVRPRVTVDRTTRRSSNPVVSGTSSRSNEPGNRSTVNTTRQPQQSRTPRSLVRNIMQDQPTTNGGVVRSRRRSEIHQQLLMRKGDK